MSVANNSPLSALLKGVLTSFILTFIVFIFLPERSHFFPKTQTILHYLNKSHPNY